MMDTPLHIESRGRVRLLTLNRPEALNAFDDDLYDATTAALQEAAQDDGVAVAVITGAGRAFTAGQDLGELGNPLKHADGQRHGFPPFIETLEAFPKPLLAAVNGLGVGIGLTMLPHCDLVLMSEEAKLRAPFASLGVTVEAGNSFLLPQTVGWANAARILFTAEWISPAECADMGLAWKITSADALLPETMSVAGQIAAMPIPSLTTTKKLLLDARLDAIRAAREREIPAFASLIGGPANREALAAFAEKRAPDFADLSP